MQQMFFSHPRRRCLPAVLRCVQFVVSQRFVRQRELYRFHYPDASLQNMPRQDRTGRKLPGLHRARRAIMSRLQCSSSTRRCVYHLQHIGLPEVQGTPPVEWCVHPVQGPPPSIF